MQLFGLMLALQLLHRAQQLLMIRIIALIDTVQSGKNSCVTWGAQLRVQYGVVARGHRNANLIELALQLRLALHLLLQVLN